MPQHDDSKGTERLFADKRKIPIHALLLAEYIDVNAAPAKERLASFPTVLKVERSGYAVVFR